MGAYAFVVFSLAFLALQSEYSDRHDPGVVQQLAKQRAEENEYARKPFEPELSSASLAAANVMLADPLAAKGKTIFEAQSCNACHGDGGAGTAAAPALIGISAKFSPEQLAELFKHPTAKMNVGGMPPIDLPPDDLKAVIAYVEGLKQQSHSQR
jgi:mono/diheme cytochrome c family protein